MKAIISHDIDHISVKEHRKDLIVPKFLTRTLLEKLSGAITGREFNRRLYETFITGKWQNIEELMQFDLSHNIPSTFFIGVKNGLGLSYSLQQASYWVDQIKRKGFSLGLHGISFDEIVQISYEYDVFRSISGLDQFGVRTHYLRLSNHTLEFFNEIGFEFDTSDYSIKSPYRIGTMVEFPLIIMDSRIFNPNHKLFPLPLGKAKDETRKIIDKTEQLNIPYLTILHHDMYYSDSFIDIKNWYEWLIEFLIQNNIQLIDYSNAVNEFSHKRSEYE